MKIKIAVYRSILNNYTLVLTEPPTTDSFIRITEWHEVDMIPASLDEVLEESRKAIRNTEASFQDSYTRGRAEVDAKRKKLESFAAFGIPVTGDPQ